MVRHKLWMLIAGAGLMLSAATAWAIPMDVPQNSGAACSDSCLPDADGDTDLMDIKWLYYLQTMGSLNTFRLGRDLYVNNNAGGSSDEDIDNSGDDDDDNGVPEPGPLALVGLGLVLLGFKRKRFSR